MADGAYDIHKQLNLSGEPLIPDLCKVFKAKDPISLLEYQKLTVEGRDYEAAYSDYWNSTRCDKGMSCGSLNVTRSSKLNKIAGQLVDAVIMPVAPHAAVIPGKYYHTGKLLPGYLLHALLD